MPGKIHVPVTVATNGFDKIQRTFSRLKGVAIGVTAALGGLAAASRAIDFTGAAIQGARDLERNYAGLKSVFKDNTDQMLAFGETASDLGLSMSEAAKSTTFIGSVLKQSGFAMQETSDLTEELVSLGADLALTFGYDIQESLLAMTALFRGEYDPIEKFGVAMKQSEIDAEKLARGLDGVTGAEERLVDQQIRVEFLMDRAADAMGAVERQSGNLTVQQMRLRAEFENLRDTVADDLLQPIADFTGGLREIVDDVAPRLEDQFDRLAPILTAVGDDALDAIEVGIDGILNVSEFFIGFLENATTEGSNLNTSLGNAGTAISELASSITSRMPTMEENVDGLSAVVGGLADAVARLADNIRRSGDLITEFFDNLNVAGQVAAATGIGALALSIKSVRTQFVKLAKWFRGHPLITGLLLGTEVVGTGSRVFEENAEFAERYEQALTTVSDAAKAQLETEELLEIQYLASLAAYGELEEMMKDPEIARLAEEFGFATDGVLSFNGSGNELARDGIPKLSAAINPLPPFLDELAGKFRGAATEAQRLNEALANRKAQGAAVSPGFDPDFEYDPPEVDEPELPDPGPVVTDYVKEFFDGIKEGIEQESARLDLEALGLSEALIDQIVGSEGWEEIFQTIIDGGADMARQLQDDFNQTGAGIAEIAEAAEELEKELESLRKEQEALQQQIKDTQEEQKKALKEATDAFYEYKEGINSSVDALDTYERSIGRFESQTRSDLERITSQINNAFDNDYLLMEARDNLLEYARAELNTLAQIQRQRDELLTRRNAAADVIFGIADSVAAAGNITGLLQDVEDSVEEIEVTELFERMAKSADGLRDFKVTVERNFTDVVRNTVDKSKSLVSNFQAVIDRTRGFIDNLKILRELGLDPFLFNQLVESGAEAGGATAQALVEGGAATVNEVNMLQTELEAMGVELGEQTYEVTKNSGEQFVSGIIDGMDSELENLQMKAAEMASSFTFVFAEMFEIGMDNAFERITDTIKEEFREMIAELNAEIAKLEDKKRELTGDTSAGSGSSFTPPPGTLFPGDPGYGDVRIVGSGQDRTLSPEEYREEFGYRGSNEELMNAGGGAKASTTVNQITVNTTNPLDASYAAKQTVQNQANYQSANGDITVVTSGVGN